MDPLYQIKNLIGVGLKGKDLVIFHLGSDHFSFVSKDKKNHPPSEIARLDDLYDFILSDEY